jgi:hypothetical protein
MALSEALREYNKKREGKSAAVPKKELDAQRIEIECVETSDGKNDGYIVCVTPKDKKKDGKNKGATMEYRPPIKRVFESEESTLAYLKKVL